MKPFIVQFATRSFNGANEFSSVKRRYDPASEMNYDTDIVGISIRQLRSQLDTGSLITEAETDTTSDEPTDR